MNISFNVISFIKYLMLLSIMLFFYSCTDGDDTKQVFRRDCRLKVYYRNTLDSTLNGKISVIGDFNSWKSGINPLKDEDNNGIYSAFIELDPGTYQYKIDINGKTYNDKFNPLTFFDENDEENSFVEIDDCLIPQLEVQNFDIKKDNIIVRVFFNSSKNKSLISKKSVSILLDNKTIKNELINIKVNKELGEVILELTQISKGKHWLKIDAEDELGVFADTLNLPFWIEDKQFTWDDALIYQIITDRFKKAGGKLDSSKPITHYHGGNFDGITEMLETGYFEKLGINVLWISPPYDNPDGEYDGYDDRKYEGYHGYWPLYNRKVESKFGGENALKNLITKAHEKGIRVIMDAVINHVHIENEMYTKNVDKDWFNSPDGSCVCGSSCSWSQDIEYCWFNNYLPDFNWKSLEVKNAHLNDSIWWIKEFDFDGFRIDAVPMMPRLAVRHLRDRIFKNVEQSGLHFFLLGECYTGGTGWNQIRYYLGKHALSGQFDFPLMWSLREVIAKQNGKMEDIHKVIEKSISSWEGSGASMGLMIGNHDVTRFMNEVTNNTSSDPTDHYSYKSEANNSDTNVISEEKTYFLLQKLAFALIYGLPGVPVLYYGDEIGLLGGSDPDNRRDMKFDSELNDSEKELLKSVQKLGYLRRELPALRHGNYKFINADKDQLSFKRDAGEKGTVLFVFNRSGKKVVLNLKASISDVFGIGVEIADVFSNWFEVKQGSLHVTVPAFSYTVLVPRTDFNKLDFNKLNSK